MTIVTSFKVWEVAADQNKVFNVQETFVYGDDAFIEQEDWNYSGWGD